MSVILDTLFGIVSQVREYSRVKTTPYTIQAFHGESMTISIDKVIVEQLVPDTMHELAAAVCEYIGFLTVTRNHIMDFVWDL